MPCLSEVLKPTLVTLVGPTLYAFAGDLLLEARGMCGVRVTGDDTVGLAACACDLCAPDFRFKQARPLLVQGVVSVAALPGEKMDAVMWLPVVMATVVEHGFELCHFLWLDHSHEGVVP